MSKAGDEPARIAAKLNISVEEVKECVHNFESARASVSSDIVDMATNAEFVTGIDGAGDRIQEAMRARRFVAYTRTGDPIFEPDHQTALDAIKTAGDMLSQVRPKGGGVNVAVGIQNSPGNGNGQVKTFEQRVREKRGMLADGDVKFLSDGQDNEIVDGEELEEDELVDETMDGTSDAEIEESG